jgi:hypothetical protein
LKDAFSSGYNNAPKTVHNSGVNEEILVPLEGQGELQFFKPSVDYD